jgi:tetratricopeptide (TPR) repeat protein
MEEAGRTMTDLHTELELAQPYAAGLLDPAATATFEEHLLLCEQCQTEVRLAVGLRQILRATPVSRPSRRTRWIVGASALLAAGLATFLLLPGGVNPKLAALGQVQEPPAYIGVSVRSLPQQGDSLFDAGMTAYVTRHYDAAVTGLRGALAAGVDTIPTNFFLASAELMAGRPSDAAADYGRVIAAGPAATAYLAEAHLYRARAFLQLGRATEALSELAAVERTDALIAARASALSDSLRTVMSR